MLYLNLYLLRRWLQRRRHYTLFIPNSNLLFVYGSLDSPSLCPKSLKIYAPMMNIVHFSSVRFLSVYNITKRKRICILLLFFSPPVTPSVPPSLITHSSYLSFHILLFISIIPFHPSLFPLLILCFLFYPSLPSLFTPSLIFFLSALSFPSPSYPSPHSLSSVLPLSLPLTLNSPSPSSISRAYPDTLVVGCGDQVAVMLLFSPTHSSVRNSGAPGAVSAGSEEGVLIAGVFRCGGRAVDRCVFGVCWGRCGQVFVTCRCVN